MFGGDAAAMSYMMGGKKIEQKKNLSALIDFIASKVKELEAKENG